MMTSWKLLVDAFIVFFCLGLPQFEKFLVDINALIYSLCSVSLFFFSDVSFVCVI